MASDSNPPPRWTETVRRHWKDTVGFVAAQSAECLEVQTQESWGPATRVPGRRFRPIPTAELAKLVLPASWFMGIILCPGDDIHPILSWLESLDSAGRERVILYVHPRFQEAAARQAWNDHGLGAPKTVWFDGSWDNFHRLYGKHHAWRVYQDHPA